MSDDHVTPDDDQDGPPFHGHIGQAHHRTVGARRAWCADCREWCYPAAGCPCCCGPRNEQEAELLADYEAMDKPTRALFLALAAKMAEIEVADHE